MNYNAFAAKRAARLLFLFCFVFFSKHMLTDTGSKLVCFTDLFSLIPSWAIVSNHKTNRFSTYYHQGEISRASRFSFLIVRWIDILFWFLDLPVDLYWFQKGADRSRLVQSLTMGIYNDVVILDVFALTRETDFWVHTDPLTLMRSQASIPNRPTRK